MHNTVPADLPQCGQPRAGARTARPTAAPLVAAAVLGLAGLLAGSPSAWANVDSARSRGAAWLLQQQRGDGSWANVDGALPVQATSAALLALKHAGLAGAPTFGTAAAWLANAGTDSIDSTARKIEALAAAGLALRMQAEADRLYQQRANSSSALWGGYGGNGVDHVDTALGLQALRLGDSGYSAKAAAGSNNTILGALCTLAGQRVAVAAGQQAWAATGNATGQSAVQGRPSLVATALLLAELRAVQQRTGLSGFSCPTPYTLATLLSEAQAWLANQQNADGGFGEQRSSGAKGSSSVLTTAWAYRALAAQAAPPAAVLSNARTWLLAQQDGATGSWRVDPLVTASVMATLPPATGVQLADADRDGIPDVVEQQLPGQNAGVADGRNPLTPPGLALPGQTTAAFTAPAVRGQAFNLQMVSLVGHSLATGGLPPGISFSSASGQFSGAPLQAGSFSFEYRKTVAGDTSLLLGRIDVADPLAGGTEGDVPIPLWALLALGGGLAAAHARRRR